MVKRATKGEIVGACRFCRRPLKYAGTGRRGKVCKRKACVRADSLARTKRYQSRKGLDVSVKGA